MLSTRSAVALSSPLLQVAMSPAATTTGSLAASAVLSPIGLRTAKRPRVAAADRRAHRFSFPLVFLGAGALGGVVLFVGGGGGGERQGRGVVGRGGGAGARAVLSVVG